jgi:hypothetical protein
MPLKAAEREENMKRLAAALIMAVLISIVLPVPVLADNAAPFSLEAPANLTAELNMTKTRFLILRSGSMFRRASLKRQQNPKRGISGLT